jgi:uracil-DNA glycosylase
MVSTNIHSDWFDFYTREQNKSYFKELIDKLLINGQSKVILPSKENWLRVFEIAPKDIKVVIIGQDPYPTKGNANGLAFSVNADIFPLPKSLKNIFKEIEEDYPSTNHLNGDLTYLFNQGVFLINTILTVNEGLPLSHKKMGWEIFTTEAIKHLVRLNENIVFLLWGKNAHTFESIIPSENNFIIKTSHPSPLGYTKSGTDFLSFKKSNQFRLTNEYLSSNNRTQIQW